MLGEVCSWSNFSSNIFWLIQADFHFGWIWEQFHPIVVFQHCVECKTYAVECVSTVFIDIWLSIICGVPQKVKRREGHKQEKREGAKIACKKEKNSNTKADWTDDKLSLLIDMLVVDPMGRVSPWLYQAWHKVDSIQGDCDIVEHKYSLNKNIIKISIIYNSFKQKI